VRDAWPLELATADPEIPDPRRWKIMALTSLLLPVELTPDGLEVVAFHYDKAIAPQHSFQCRVSRTLDKPRWRRWLMTTW
jgi:hypothetical protein